MKMSKTQHGRALRQYMKQVGMKRRRELARELELSDATISLYFSGKRSFSPKTAIRISRHTGIPMELLYQ